MLIVMVGARDRSSVKKQYTSGEEETYEEPKPEEIEAIQRGDKEFIKRILTKMKERFGMKLCVVSYGCDDGIGLIVRDLCEELKVKFAEANWYFHRKDRSKIDYTKFYIARNASVIEIGDMFYLFVNKRRNSTVEDLLKRILEMKQFKNEDRPYVMYDEACKTINTNMSEDLI